LFRYERVNGYSKLLERPRAKQVELFSEECYDFDGGVYFLFGQATKQSTARAAYTLVARARSLREPLLLALDFICIEIIIFVARTSGAFFISSYESSPAFGA
jgi:hypothetical protein